MSSSAIPEVAQRFNKPDKFYMIIQSKTGRPISNQSSVGKGEFEVLFGPETKI